MKKYEFYMTEYSDTPGYEIVLYTSKDVNGHFMSERNCFIAVLKDLEMSYDPEELEVFSVYTLESILLKNNVYVSFIDDTEE